MVAGSAVNIVMRKELRDSLRDRRTLFNMLVLGPLLGPLLFVLLIQVIVARQLEQAEKPLPVVVIGAEYAPNLVEALRQGGVQAEAPVADVERAVREQRVQLALRIPPDYGKRWIAGKPGEVELIYDSSRREAGSQAERVEKLVENYGARTAAVRLMMRGLPPTLIQPVLVAERDQASPQARSALLFAMLPYFLVFAVLFGGMSLAIDATAGERERQSLEPLLANPVPGWQVLLGKVLATLWFSLLSAFLSLVVVAIVGRLMASNRLGLELHLDARFMLTMVPVLVPMAALIVVLQTMVAAHARNFREAQTWLGLLQLIPIIPTLLLSIWPISPPAWLYAVPIASQQVTILRLLRAEPVSALQLGTGAACTLLLAWAAFELARRRYASERLAISS